MEESRKRRPHARGKCSRWCHSTAWKMDKTLGWYCVLDFLGTFGSHLQFRRSKFKSFLWDVIGVLREEESGTTVQVEGGDILSQDPEDGNHQKMQRALEVLPGSMLEKLVDESRELISSGHCSAHHDIAASSGDSTQQWQEQRHRQEAVFPDHDEAM